MLEQRASSSRYNAWSPRPMPLDPCTRKMIFGPVQPMEQPGLLQRLLGAERSGP